MAGKTYQYDENVYIKPGVNGEFLVWLALLGIPALLLFLVFTRQHEGVPAAAPHQPAAMTQPAPSDAASQEPALTPEGTVAPAGHP